MAHVGASLCQQPHASLSLFVVTVAKSKYQSRKSNLQKSIVLEPADWGGGGGAATNVFSVWGLWKPKNASDKR